MTANSLSIYNSIIKPSSWIKEIPLLLSFNLLLVATSYISFNIPFSPVPITGQTLGVLLVAMALGRVRGTGVVLAYLAEGAAGLPVFAGGTAGMVKFMGPTGGYLFGFLAAAFVVGYLADKGWDRKYLSSILAMVIGTLIILFFGLFGLSRFVEGQNLMILGLYPFIPGALIKIAAASVMLPSIWKFIRK